jgi:hypothetical protein
MTPEAIVSAVKAAGASVEFLPGGKAKILGVVPPDVMGEIRAQREEFLDAWRDMDRGRWCKCPPGDLVMRKDPPRWRQDVYRRVEAYVRRQGGEVCLWATLRATAYHEAKEGWTAAAATASALADVLHWQMSHRPDPEGQLQTFEEVAAYFRNT